MLNQKVMTDKIGDFLIVPLVSPFQSVASKCQIFVMEMIFLSYKNKLIFKWKIFQVASLLIWISVAFFAR